MGTAVRNAPEAERYELTVDGELAGFAEYRGHGELRALTHTEIDDRFAGRGLATTLIREVLDDVRAQGNVHVLPLCPFVKAFLVKHREYLDLVAPQNRAAFDLPEPGGGGQRNAR